MSDKLYFFISASPICGVCLEPLKADEAFYVRQCFPDPISQKFECVNEKCPQFKQAMIIRPFEANRQYGFSGFVPLQTYPYRSGQFDEPFCGHCGARKK